MSNIGLSHQKTLNDFVKYRLISLTALYSASIGLFTKYYLFEELICNKGKIYKLKKGVNCPRQWFTAIIKAFMNEINFLI